MDTMRIMAAIFLLGAATPFLGLRIFVKQRDSDGSGCLLNFILFVFLFLVVAVLIVGRG